MNKVMIDMEIYEKCWLFLEDKPQELAKFYRAYIHKKRCCENADRVIKEMKKKRERSK